MPLPQPTSSGPSDGLLPLLPGIAVTSLSPDGLTALTAAMLIVVLASQGDNVAALVPVETGIEDPCEPGSAGALVRWASGHLDDPRLVTPFALEANRSAMHAADASGTLLHVAAFEKARVSLCEGRSVLVVADAVGPLDPISPSLTMLDLVERWQLAAVIVEPVSRWTVGHVRLLVSSLLVRKISVAGVILTHESGTEIDVDTVSAIRDTLSVEFDCPVLELPPLPVERDRHSLLAAAQAAGLQRLLLRRAPPPSS